jgi:hypothetical protein
VVGDADAVPSCDDGEGDDPDGKEDGGKEDVGALRGADPTILLPPTALSLLVVWPFRCNTVWPWAVVMPRNMIAMMKTRFTALSCVECRNAALSPVLPDNARSAKNENEI